VAAAAVVVAAPTNPTLLEQNLSIIHM
jgi:hypothetical protein